MKNRHAHRMARVPPRHPMRWTDSEADPGQALQPARDLLHPQLDADASSSW